jgi:hypothetical protein
VYYPLQLEVNRTLLLSLKLKSSALIHIKSRFADRLRGNKMFKKGFLAVMAVSLFSLMQPAISATTTGMVFAGGCVEGSVTALCENGANASEANVAAILGFDVTDVTQINSGFSIIGIDDTSGTWSITDSSITHLAFKSNGYFILGEIVAPATSGDWDNDPSSLGEWNITNVACPASICGSDRAYTLADFENGGGNIADLSNARAFSVVPIPAAVWLFGSALAGLGWMRRKQTV